MPTTTIVNGEIVHELSLGEFKAGLFRLAGENHSNYNRLMLEFNQAVLEEVIKTTQAKNKGESNEQIIFERIKRKEARKHYRKLKQNLKNANIKKPLSTAAHHIVSWHDARAEDARAILQQYGIDIDCEHNGEYLPRFKKYVPHKEMPKAYAHSMIHTAIYYVNVTSMLISQARIKGTTKDDIIDVLREIAHDLKNGTFPIFHKDQSLNR